MDDLPYLAEYAKSGRAACKGCKEKIENGSLRLAVMVQSAFHDGKQPNWFHEECFFKKQRPKSVSDISKLNTLRHEDQKRIAETIENCTGIVMPIEKKGKGKKRANADNAGALRDFAVEYSKSSRASCKVCEIKICKDEVRISKTVFDTEIGQKYGGQPLWHHVQCFAENRAELLYMAGGEDLPGFNKLKKEDKKMVKDAIKPLKTEEIPVKKLKEEPKDADDIKKEKDIEKKHEKQNKTYFKYFDALKEYTKPQLEEILRYNSQEVVPNKDDCMSRVADMMAFGALEPCPQCKNGQLVLENYGYKCSGNMSEWSKCTNVVIEPKRVPMKVPKSFKDGAAFLKFKPKTAVRLFKVARPPPVIIKKEDPEESVKKSSRPIPPLKNLQFFLYGKLRSKEDTKRRILKLGGLVVSKLTETTAAVVSTKRDLENMPAKMMEIQEQDIEVVEESFVDLIDPEKGTVANSIQLIKDNNIAPWGSDPAKRIPQDVLDGKSIPKSGSMYVSTKSAPKKLKIKDGVAVDPDTNLEDVAHVYKDGSGQVYSVVLGKTDIVAKKNSYYKLQVLEEDKGSRYWIFRSWGRIGTTIGGNKLESTSSAHKAIAEFEKYYEEKTQNSWHDRDNFVKVPEAYYPIEMDYGEESKAAVPLTEDTNCKLPLPVQQLVIKIFDVKNMQRTLLEFELDTEKMPLGKLSKKQIRDGYKILSNLLEQLQKGKANNNEIIDATNRFYTLVPHSFGKENPPLLDDVELIKKKTEMLDNMLEIEIAYNLLQTEKSSNLSLIETQYLKLKSEIVPLVTESPEYQMLLKYVKNTHAKTHAFYDLDVEQIFKVVREGEEKRYKPFKKLHNRRLLWHGSRMTNFAGILSLGLRIAPPEAPVTGYMFGKGVYFADMVSKSANYCCTNPANNVGVMLLCEVALGEMKKCTQAEYVKSLPAGTHSVWGMGKTMPDPKQDVVLDCGTVVPLGTPIDTDVSSSLLYNEFIVYDVAQVKIKYLFQMKFSYKY